MNKFRLSALLIALTASGASFSLMAAETSSINITGKVIPASCSLGSGVTSGVQLIQVVNVADLKAKGLVNNAYQHSQLQRDINVSCDAAVPVAITFTADKSVSSVVNSIGVAAPGITTSNPDYLASLGEVNGKPIGYYMFSTFAEASGGTGNNSNSQIISDDGGSSWALGSGVALKQNGIQLLAKGSTTNGPQSTNDITFPVRVSMAFNPEIVDATRDAIDFSANTTVTLKYL